jgi:hypothetical protein
MPPSPTNIFLPWRQGTEDTWETPDYKRFTHQKTIMFTVNSLENINLTIPPTMSFAISFTITFLSPLLRKGVCVSSGSLPASTRPHTVRAVASNETSQNTTRVSSVHYECTTTVCLRNQSKPNSQKTHANGFTSPFISNLETRWLKVVSFIIGSFTAYLLTYLITPWGRVLLRS